VKGILLKFCVPNISDLLLI